MRISFFIGIAASLAFSCGHKENNADADTAEVPWNATEAIAPSAAEATPLSPAETRGKEIFESTGACVACHKPEGDILAPSLGTVGAAYKGKPGHMVTFLKGKADPIVDPDRFQIMKTNFAITATMSDDELKSVEAYVLSFAK